MVTGASTIKENYPKAFDEAVTNLSQTAPQRFLHFVFSNRSNRVVLCIIVALIVSQFIIFKLFYPFANYMPDSYYYIAAASLHMDINIWPIGYSKLLIALRVISHSDTAIVLFQYLFLQASLLYFIYTLLYLLKPGKVVQYILPVALCINPILLSISNYITADAVFTALSFLWAVQLLRILTRPKFYHLWIQAILLLLAFTMRYNALYYPFISVAVFLVSTYSWQKKLAGMALTFLLIAGFIWHSSNTYEQFTGTRQFSAFSGWQMASNALVIYSFIKDDHLAAIPLQFNDLHRTVTRQMDSIRQLKNRPDSILSTYFLWNEQGPLKQYMHHTWRTDSTTAYFKKWASMAPLYLHYGRYLIREHPVSFTRYYLWPNTINYYAPPMEVLGIYNMGKDSVEQLAKDWFGYRSLKVRSHSKDIGVVHHYSLVPAAINILFLGGLAGFIFLKGFKGPNRTFKVLLLLTTGIWAVNLCFSVLASPVVLRYQLFPLILCFSAGVLLVEYIYQSDYN